MERASERPADAPLRSPRFKMGHRQTPSNVVASPPPSSQESPQLPSRPSRDSAQLRLQTRDTGKPAEPVAASPGRSSASASPPSSRLKKSPVSGAAYVLARDSYEAESANHISVARGDRILLVRQAGDWCVGRTDFGEEGLFPAALVAAADDGAAGKKPGEGKKKVSLKEKMAETLRSTANSAKSTAQALSKSAKESGAKVMQKGKGIIAARNQSGGMLVAKAADSGLRENQSSAYHVLHDEMLKDRPELQDFFRVLLQCVVRPAIVASVQRRRDLAVTNPVAVTVGSGEEMMLQKNASIDVQWKTFSHLMKSFGIADVVDSNAGWKPERNSEFAGAVDKFVESFFLLRELGSTSSQVCEEAEIVHALLHAHLPKGHVLRLEKDVSEGRSEDKVLVILCMLVLRRGGLTSESVFRSGGHEEAAGALLEAIESNDEAAIEAAECDVAAALLLQLLSPAMLPPIEECIKASDWSKAENALLSCLLTSPLATLVFLSAFFRLFRHADIVAVLVETLFRDCAQEQIQPLQDFVALMLQHMPLHFVGEGAVGFHVLVTSRTTKKQARGVIVAYEKEKDRYVARLGNGQDVAVRNGTDAIEWLHWGNLPSPQLLREAHLAPLLVEDGYSHAQPLRCLLKYYDSHPTGSLAFEDKLLTDEAFVTGLIQFLDSDKSKKHCLLGTVKAIVEVFSYRSLEAEFLQRVVGHFVREEVSETESLGTLFRGSSPASRVISAFIDVVGHAMLHSCLANAMCELVSADADRLVDKESMDLQSSQKSVTMETAEEEVPYDFIARHAALFMNAIVESKSDLPLAVRSCCGLVADIVAAKFPDEEEFARRLAVGNVLFLRFFVPAIMSPVDSGLLPGGSTLTPSVQSHLKLITAAIQCIANQTTFSASKPSAALNELFIEPERERTNSFLQQVCTVEEGENVSSAPVTQSVYEHSLFTVLLTSYLLKPDSLE